MSSRYKDGQGLSPPACGAVNGRMMTKYRTVNQSQPNCVHTDNEDYSSWWRVDLKRPYTITGVTIYRRAACPNGTFGQNCQETCGLCKANDPCDVTTGHCQECSGSFAPPFCKEVSITSPGGRMRPPTGYRLKGSLLTACIVGGLSLIAFSIFVIGIQHIIQESLNRGTEAHHGLYSVNRGTEAHHGLYSVNRGTKAHHGLYSVNRGTKAHHGLYSVNRGT
ncbi:hypothetical protein ACOMHN_050144 [Nucella lapillus]